MAKPTIKFTTVAYKLGDKTGYRPQLEAQNGVYDLDFCKEVVTEKRLAMSADELLHAVEMLGEVAANKVSADGRPRGITKLIKWNRYAKGSLESPSDAWNDSCSAEIKPQLLADAAKTIDATFVNVNEGINVKLSYVAWPGAKTVINVIKIGKRVIAYGNHMEFLTGDTAKLTIGTTDYELTCTESDVAHAAFSWPLGCEPEAGTEATFLMSSRGGVEDGQVYNLKKVVTVLAADLPLGTLTDVRQHEGETADLMYAGATNDATGTNLSATKSVVVELLSEAGKICHTENCTSVTATDTSVQFSISAIDPTDFPQDGTAIVTLYAEDGDTVVAKRNAKCHIPGR